MNIKKAIVNEKQDQDGPNNQKGLLQGHQVLQRNNLAAVHSRGEPASDKNPKEMSSGANAVLQAREAFKSGITKLISFRREQLIALLKFYSENKHGLITALEKDLNKSKHETIMMEFNIVINDLKDTITNLKEWAKPERPPKSFVNWMDKVYILNEPLGVVLILGAWNYPLQLLMCPVAGAIAAGNCVIMKPSEIASATSDYIFKHLPKYLNPDCYHVVVGGISETTELLKQRFDYIFFTGSTHVGKIIHQAANKYLTPCTLELGGKSPCYIDDSVNIKLALKRIIWGKCVNLGQTCIAPDYILCTEEVEKLIIQEVPAIIKEFFGNDPKSSPDLSRIINDRNFERLIGLMKHGNIVIGGQTDASERYIAPTFITNVKSSDPIMKEEIFGPLMPIVRVKNVQSAIDFVNEGEKPLSLYIFSSQPSIVWLIINNASSGGVCVNDTIMHFAVDGLPFGGVGFSGMGRYHAKYTFETFSHKRSCLYKNYNALGEALASKRYPPYSNVKTNFITALMTRRPAIPFKLISYICIFGLGLVTSFVVRLLKY